MFWKRIKKKTYDKVNQKPVVRSSICTGEKVAGFKDIHTEKFTDVMLIRDDKDLNEFMRQYGIREDEIGKEW